MSNRCQWAASLKTRSGLAELMRMARAKLARRISYVSEHVMVPSANTAGVASGLLQFIY